MPRRAGLGSRRGRQPRRVVIVDPHDDSRALYADYFEWAGVHVAVVPTAAHALRLTCQEPPEAVITCLRLPAMDGFALCDALRTMPHTRRIPVIAISTCRLDHERALCDARFAQVLMKPFSPVILLDSLREALARERTRSSYTSGAPEARMVTAI